jgi:integrating conjugative element protein (TIGR03746 family)
MAYLDALEEQRRQTTLRNYLIGALLLIVGMCLIGWQGRQNEITVHVRPGLTQEVSVKANEMPAENVFNFALTLMMQIYRWRTDGRTEYPANVKGLYVYMSEQCQLNLLADAEQRDKSGELGERTRVWEPMSGSYFSPERVQVIDDRTWLVTIDAELRESVRAQTVKEGFFRYQIYVQSTGSDRDVNPYGLQLNCFAPGSPSKLEPTSKPLVTP